jgi:hypothetical protein
VSIFRTTGFLKGRRIQDAIGSAHETLHSIKKKKNIKSLVLKLDLKKAYDNIDWEYLRMILLTVGFGVKLMDWIMCCVTSASFAVLINERRQIISRVGGGFVRDAHYPRIYSF